MTKNQNDLIEYRVEMLEKEQKQLTDNVNKLTESTTELCISVKLMSQQMGAVKWITAVAAAAVIGQLMKMLVG